MTDMNFGQKNMQKYLKQKSIILGMVAAILILLSSCSRRDQPRFRDLESLKPELTSKLEAIREAGILKVVTEYNSISYFIYRGQPLGFQYEMLKDLAGQMELELEVSVSNDLEQNFTDLEEGTVDLIAMSLTITSERKEKVAFTVPLLQTRQVLTQRKPKQWEKMNSKQIENSLIRNQLDLAGKMVYVQAGSVYADTCTVLF